MSLIPFDSLPDNARLWIFNAGANIDPALLPRMESAVSAFLEEWTAHSIDVPAGFQVLYNRFLLIGADTTKTTTSGCSIDALTRFIRSLEPIAHTPLLDAPDVCFRRGPAVECVTRAQFDKLVATGEVGAKTVVFDNTVATVGDLRSGHWERPAEQTWHAAAFALG